MVPIPYFQLKSHTTHNGYGHGGTLVQRLSSKIFLPLFTVFLRPHLKHYVKARSLYLRRDAEKLEGVQRFAIRMVVGLRNALYEEYLVRLNLYFLERRRRRVDQIARFRIINRVNNNIDP